MPWLCELTLVCSADTQLKTLELTVVNHVLTGLPYKSGSVQAMHVNIITNTYARKQSTHHKHHLCNSDGWAKELV
ncbi:hypothetical protein Hanom_Chr16g01467241 [Helianthus anomalus]